MREQERREQGEQERISCFFPWREGGRTQAYTDQFYWGVYGMDSAGTVYFWGKAVDQAGATVGFLYGYNLADQRIGVLSIDYNNNEHLRQYNAQYNLRTEKYSKTTTILLNSEIDEEPQFLDTPRPAYLTKCATRIIP